MHPTDWVAGADGFRGGWIVVLERAGVYRARRVETASALLALPEQPLVIALDMVIGLPDVARRGGRDCDALARKRLGWPRSSSVFSPPTRAALEGATYAEALALHRATGGPDAPGFSIEAYNLFPKIREVDALMTPALQTHGTRPHIAETHPEVAFAAMNGGASLRPGKRTPEGRALRYGLLEQEGLRGVEAFIQSHKGRGVKPDDVADAAACCWSARRIAEGRAVCLPPDPPRDARGLAQAIWF